MFSPLENEELDRWFQRLNAPLKRLPADERANLHLEVRQHLEALVAANEELGSTPEEAWKHALIQFGDSGSFGKKMAQEWRQDRTDFRAVMVALRCGVGVHATSVLGLVAMLFLIDRLLLFPMGLNEPTGLLGIGYFVGVPLITGLVIGRKHPCRALTAALYTSLVLPISPVAFAAFALSAPHVTKAMMFWVVLKDLGPVCTDSLLLNCGAAYLASVTKRGWYKPTWEEFKLTLPKQRRVAG